MADPRGLVLASDKKSHGSEREPWQNRFLLGRLAFASACMS